MILDGRLRVSRKPWMYRITQLRISQAVTANLLNLSQGGVGIRAHRTLAATGPVNVSFALPGTSSRSSFVVSWRGRTTKAMLGSVSGNGLRDETKPATLA